MVFKSLYIFYETCLTYAIKSGKLDVVKYLISLEQVDIQRRFNVFLKK